MTLVGPVLESFAGFLEAGVAPEERALRGLHGALACGFPIVDFSGSGILTYESYALERPRFDRDACYERGLSHVAPLKLTVRLYTGTPGGGPEAARSEQEAGLLGALRRAPGDLAARAVYGDWLEERGDRARAAAIRKHGGVLDGFAITDIKEQELYFGELPLLGEDGTFVLDGEAKALVVTRTKLWCPGDATADGVERLVLPGAWLAHCIGVAMARTAERIRARMPQPSDLAFLMPHDLIEPRDVYQALRALFRKRASARSVPGDANPLAHAVAVLPELGPGADLVPLAADDAARAVGEAALQRAATLVTPTLAAITAGGEALVGRTVGVRAAPCDAVAERIDDSTLLLWPVAPEDVPAASVLVVIAPFLRARLGFVEEIAVADGAAVRRGQPITRVAGLVDGSFAPGRQARVVFDPRAKGAIVSQAFCDNMACRLVAEEEVTIADGRQGRESLAPHDAPHLDELGVVRPGARIRPGDILVGRTRRAQDGTVTDAHVAFAPRVRGSGADGPWTVMRVDFFRRPGAELHAREEAIREATKARWTAVDGAATRRQGPLAEGVRELCEERLDAARALDHLAPGVLRFLRVVLTREAPLAVGDTLTDRRGAAFKVRAIAPVEDMPLVDGVHAEVVLPAKNAPAEARLEARLGLAAEKLGERWTAGAEDPEGLLARASVAPAGGEGSLYLLRRG
jgi:uncharacterized protein (TIGR02996 family)